MKNFQNPKEAFVRECLAKAPLTVALRYRDEKEGDGFLLASKGKHSGSPWFPIYVPVKLTDGHACCKSEKNRQVGLIMGIGNRSELVKVLDIYKNIVYMEADKIGLHGKFDEKVIEGLAGELNDEYRASNQAVPYRVELMIMSFAGKTLNLTRVKADGDLHSLQGFGVIGGYGDYPGQKNGPSNKEGGIYAGYKIKPKIQDNENAETVRHVALNLLQLVYSTRIPNLGGAEELVELLMSLDDESYPYNFRAAIGVEPDGESAKTRANPKSRAATKPPKTSGTPPGENPKK
ncbi:MAG: hypothetical protein Q7S36_01915 [Candidatus Liptonbacteria bacterium]|nr:hypothetical protein [Candidatus Liptonbacteria bacterium]